MSRKTGFLEIAIRASRAAKRERAAAERHRATLLARAERERVHQLRQAGALDKQLQREAEREHVRQQQRETESLNADLEKRVEELTKLLELGLTSCNAIDFEKLKREPKSSPFETG